jgi:O-methyltransferase
MNKDEFEAILGEEDHLDLLFCIFKKFYTFEKNFLQVENKLIKDHFLTWVNISKYEDGVFFNRNNEYLLDTNIDRITEETANEIGHHYEIKWRTLTFIWFAKQLIDKNLGDLYEFGTGNGWMIRCLNRKYDLKDINVKLFDRFDNGKIDEITGEIIDRSFFNPTYAMDVKALEDITGLNNKIEVIKGELPYSLDLVKHDRIGMVHVDLNAAKPSVQSLEKIWKYIQTGGIILLDDYLFNEHKEQKKALDWFFAEKKCEILPLLSGQGVVIK